MQVSWKAGRDEFDPGQPEKATGGEHGGHYLVRGGKTLALEGEPPKRIIVTAFQSTADAQRWYASPEYPALRAIRQRAAKARGFIVEGVGE